MTDWKNWGRGLVGAAINSSVTGLSLLALDPNDFNFDATGIAKLAKIAIVTGVAGALLWMKQHPNPWISVSIGGRNRG